jgi:hypothetical protein
VNAAPLATLSLEARPTGVGTYSSTVTATVNQVYDYEVVLTMSPIGTSNTQGSTTRTISSLVDKTTSGGDGFNTLSLNISETSANPVQADFGLDTLATSNAEAPWTLAASAAPGSQTTRLGTTYHDVMGIRPGHASGIRTGAGASGDVVLTGTFTLMSVTGDGNIYCSFAGTSSGIAINGAAVTFNVTTTTEGTSDPVVAYAPLELDTGGSQTPEPASLSLIGFGCLFLLRNRLWARSEAARARVRGSAADRRLS